MIFFQPTTGFIHKVMKMVEGRTLVDVGAGEGKFQVLANDLGYTNIISIDLYPGDVHVYEFDAMEFEFHRGMVPMFIRPCHGGWVSAVLNSALDVVPFAFYVGLAENIPKDLGALSSNIEYTRPYHEWCGPDNEVLLKIMKIKEVEKEKFYLLENTKFPGMGRWFARKIDDRFINLNGGFQPVGPPLKTVETFECAESELDLTLTYLCPSDSPAGWLAPDGTWYPCRRKDHAEFAIRILGKDMQELEDEGWVHVYDPPEVPADLYFSHVKELTQAQRDWLIRHGYDVRRMAYKVDEPILDTRIN